MKLQDRVRPHYMYHLVSVFLLVLFAVPVNAQTTDYSPFFDEAYSKYPDIPRGVLEAIAYTNTRMNHIRPVVEGCQGLPEYYGVMGLVVDGKGYFNNTLTRVSELSGFSERDIIESPRINILAYAAAYSAVQQNKRLARTSIEAHDPILVELSEIPVDNSATHSFAFDQQFYSVLKEMESPHTGTQHRLNRRIDFEKVFGAENYRVLSAPSVKISSERVSGSNGATYIAPGARTADCTSSRDKANYSGAIWNAADSKNYGSREGESVQHVTIHTIQGSYASAIAWFRNPAAKVSTHYVIRASDGQVTQMVCEEDRAFHVKTDNATAIGIEHEGFIDDGGAWYTNEMYESSAALVRDICQCYKINPLQTFGGPPTNGIRTLTNTCYKVKGHQHFKGNNHIDPGPFWDWDRYYRLINPEPTPVTFTDKKGDIYDTGGANGNYGDQDRITYLIKPNEATSITVSFRHFDLEGTAEKPYDYLDIFDGENINGKYIGRFTGNKLPSSFTAQSGAVFMEFRSDCQVNQTGWQISYQSGRKDADCGNPTSLAASNIFPMGATLSWEGGAEEYLVYLSRKLEDKWALYKTTSNTITVTGLSANGVYQWQIQSVCGKDTSALIGDSFTTPNIGREGSPQNYTVRLNRGRFYDSGGSFSGYAMNENYLYRIIPPDGGRVQVKFTSFETEANTDILVAYDGPGVNSREIGRYSGKNLPAQITSTGNALTFLFTSDSRTNAPGWLSSWTSVGGTAGNNDNGNTANTGTGGNTNTGNTSPNNGNTGNTGNTNPTPPVADDGTFEADIKYPVSTPETTPVLNPSYTTGFTLKFDDKDRSGRGIVNQFYNIAYQTPSGYLANTNLGFFYDDFNSGLGTHWKSAGGNWQVVNGRLTQTNVSLGNTNLYAELKQSNKSTYVYHWKAKMTGASDNLRHGFHFFCSKPENPDRGTSYFVWIRDTDDKDYVEIYKTVNDQFDRKLTKEISLETSKVYDYKVIFNPVKGRIEVYIDNNYIGAWVDPYPLFTGKAISLRSANSLVTFDDIQVYKQREKTASVKVGNSVADDIPASGGFIVNSLVIDRNIRWSRVGRGSSFTGSTPPPPSSAEETPSGSGDESGTAPSGSSSVNADFTFSPDIPAGGQSFYLPSDYDGRIWDANKSLGFLWDDFPGTGPHPDWKKLNGSWQVKEGALRQMDEEATNSNIYLSLNQQNNTSYLYHWRTKIESVGENRRFGLHFFCSDPTQTNRGDSYFVWFRNNDSQPDKVEIYRVDENSFPSFRKAAFVTLSANEWYDCKVLFDPGTGKIDVWLNNQSVLSWQDDRTPHRAGNAISFRTGNSKVQFDDLRVYQLSPGKNIRITVGQAENDMLRFKSSGGRPAGKIFALPLESSGRWGEVKVEDIVVE
ncbi:MAG: CUB domain-containing protein [Bacteroidia bacterium]|nr:CUB domain-containing protein [Bacteroidia bacterium]